VTERCTWVTFDTPQSRSLLKGEDVVYVEYTAPRDWRNATRNLVPAWRLLSSGRFDHVISTGSGIALTFLPLARARGLRATYVESAARSRGPSLTGRIVARVPGVRLGTQYRSWEDRRWEYVGSVLDGYGAFPSAGAPEIRQMVVTLGTIPYDFRRLVDRLLAIVPDGVATTYQTGATDVSGLPIPARAEMPRHELHAAIHAADVVVAHAGTGSALAALEAGKCAILVPRERAHGEHVDDHQQQIAGELAGRGLAISRLVGELTPDDLVAAARVRIERVSAPPLELGIPAPVSEPARRNGSTHLSARGPRRRFDRQRDGARAAQHREARARELDLDPRVAGLPKANGSLANGDRPAPSPRE
jgi:UDP-N-acetylglucosamine--N-acetylmuramyl-(pentapeptide) pyrophosphoryl-undecaprenol N-acetylglucosamine transferase